MDSMQRLATYLQADLHEHAAVILDAFTSGEEVEAAFAFAMDNLDEYEKLFDWLDAQTPLTTFRALGNETGSGDAALELARLAEQVRGQSAGGDPAYWGLRNGRADSLSPS